MVGNFTVSRRGWDDQEHAEGEQDQLVDTPSPTRLMRGQMEPTNFSTSCPKWILVLSLVAAMLAATSCGTKERPKTFGLLPRQEQGRFSITEIPATNEMFDLTEPQTREAVVNSKVDLLWVIDNSSSMDPSQDRLRDALGQFARTYMKPKWDI